LVNGAARTARTSGVVLRSCRSSGDAPTVLARALFDAHMDPDAHADTVLAAIGRSRDAARALRLIRIAEYEQLAMYGGGLRIVQRAQQVLADGNVADRDLAQRLQDVLDRRAGAARTPTPAEAQALARINAAVNAETPQRLRLYERPPQPIRL